MMSPSAGRIVHYCLSAWDVDDINARKLRDSDARANVPAAGDIYPAMIVRTWGSDDPVAHVQLQVFIDGNFTLWATSREQVAADSVDREGHWFEPPRV